MTDHPFGEWLDGDRTGPVPYSLAGQTSQYRYWLNVDGDGFIRLWCHHCTAGGDDYLGEWATPTGEEYEGEVSARVREHQADKHPELIESET